MLFLGTGAAWAQSAPPPHAPPPNRDPPAQRQDRGNGNGLPDSVRRVERQTGGEVLRAEPMQRDGREVYRLKVLTADGRVRVVQDDPDRPQQQKPQRSSDSRDKGKSKGNESTSRDSDEEAPPI